MLSKSKKRAFMKVSGVIILCIASLMFSAQAAAEAGADDVNQLVGAWDVNVMMPGEPSRRMKVSAVNKKSEAQFVLDATFGFTGYEFRVSSAELTQDSQGRKLVVVARSGAKVTAMQTENGVFEGTWTPNNSNPPIPVVLKKMTEADLVAVPEVKPVPPGTPASCAAFVGGWDGTWPISGPVWLWVVEIDANCNAKYSYGRNKNPKTFFTGLIKDGVLTVQVSIGMNYFSFDKGVLYDKFVGSNGESFLAFKKMNQ